jgi:hypothetical protein
VEEFGLIVAGAVLGAALTFLSAQGTARLQRRRDNEDAIVRDLDETRRLLLIVEDTVRNGRPKEVSISPGLAATIANALSGHSKLMDSATALTFMHELRQGFAVGKTHAPLERLRRIVEKIDALLAGEPAQSATTPPPPD